MSSKRADLRAADAKDSVAKGDLRRSPWSPTPEQLAQALKYWLSDISNFSRLIVDLPLRRYQLRPAREILRSILRGEGREFAVLMARQAGKNELSGQLEAYLLNLFRRRGGQIVKASPTYKPQTINSILRLTQRLNNCWNRGQWRRREGYIVELDAARTLFFSAGPRANVVGGTASLLLECDEAQDVDPIKWDKDFTPMGASTNATTVFWGTAWTSKTLLAQTYRRLQRLEKRDGKRRVFKVTADEVAEEVPAYGAYVARQVAKKGREHPLIKTQYYLEEIDAQGGLFPKHRRALMHGDHERKANPQGGYHALLIDVAGEDEEPGDAQQRALLENPQRDATALTVVDVEIRPNLLPIYRTLDRKLWLGTKHTALHGQILALAEHWHAVWIVVDATGVGAGLASFLVKSLGDRVIPVQFSPKVKSEIGWDFVGIVETGRFRDYLPDEAPETRQFWYEVENCEYEVRDGPGNAIRWGVWETPAYDGLVARGHDDLLISAALTSILDKQEWATVSDAAGAVETPDLLEDIDNAEW